MLKKWFLLFLFTVPGSLIHASLSPARHTTEVASAIISLGLCSEVPIAAQQRILALTSVDVVEIDLTGVVNDFDITCGLTYPFAMPSRIFLTTNPIAQAVCWPDGDKERTIRHEILHLGGLDHASAAESKQFYNILEDCP